MAAPLTDTIKKRIKLQEALMTAPVSRNPDFNKIFFVQCDASDYGVGNVLFQEEDNEGERPAVLYRDGEGVLRSCVSITTFQTIHRNDDVHGYY